jgi:hypothetical protein
MTKLLDRAVAAARKLPPEAQDDIAEIMLRLAGDGGDTSIPLTAGEQAAIDRSKTAAAQRDFATDDEVRAVWAKPRG